MWNAVRNRPQKPSIACVWNTTFHILSQLSRVYTAYSYQLSFPRAAIVEDDDRAIACLGGINAISKVQFTCLYILIAVHCFLLQARTDSGTTLEMRYRPEDRYCKPTVAREEKVTNLVLKVRRRKAQTDDGAERKHEYSVELLGIANENYHFPGISPCSK